MHHMAKRGQTKEEEGDAQEDTVRVAREGREGPKGLEGTQRSIQAQAGRGHQVDGQEAHRQRLEPPETPGPRRAPARVKCRATRRAREISLPTPSRGS